MISAIEARNRMKEVNEKEKDKINKEITKTIEEAISKNNTSCICYLSSYSTENIKFFLDVLKENGYKNVKFNTYHSLQSEITKYISFEW